MRIVKAWLVVFLGVIGSTRGASHSDEMTASITSEQKQDLEDLDFVVLSYNSLHENLTDTLVFGSMEASMNAASKDKAKFINVGMGDHLWQWETGGHEPYRGWMYRLRRALNELMDEYKRRGQRDFIVMVSDALDIYFTKSAEGNTLDLIKERFLADFAADNYKIVFSSQIYCCNPWELRSVARRDYDDFYASPQGPGIPPTIYKHLNAGLFMGYASAIIEMAHEMGIWENTYHGWESYASIMETEAGEYLHMRDMEVDDDEWQLAAWYFEDQKKERPLAILDYHQELFTTTATFRTQERDNGFILFSRNHFWSMFGDMPEEAFEIQEVTLCPYEFDPDSQSWINKFTGSSPLVFHFSGRDWLCGCEVMHAESYGNIPPRFRTNCGEHYEHWLDRVTQGIQYIAETEDPLEGLFLLNDQEENVLKVRDGHIEEIDRKIFGLDAATVRRMLQNDPYNPSTPTNPFMALIGFIFFCF